MTRRRIRLRHPMDNIIESALQPGRFFRWNESFSFVSNLRRLDDKILKVIVTGTSETTAWYETFIAACNLKAEEIDDSDGDFGTFAGGLFLRWIQARQAAAADPDETAKTLLEWEERDSYGFCSNLAPAAVTVLDQPGLAAFEPECAALAAAQGAEPASHYQRDHWAQELKYVYSEKRDIRKYLDLTAVTGLTLADCEAVALMHQASRKPAEALQ